MDPRCLPPSSSKSPTMRKRKEEMPSAFCHWKSVTPRNEFPAITRIFCLFTPWEKDRLTFLPIFFPQVQWCPILAPWLTTWGPWKTIRARVPPQNLQIRISGNGSLAFTRVERSPGCSNVQLKFRTGWLSPAGLTGVHRWAYVHIWKQG